MVEMKPRWCPESLPTVHGEDGRKLTGKTGSACWLDAKLHRTSTQIGWTVGWMQRKIDVFIFAHLVYESGLLAGFAGGRAKKSVFERLHELVQDLRMVVVLMAVIGECRCGY